MSTFRTFLLLIATLSTSAYGQSEILSCRTVKSGLPVELDLSLGKVHNIKLGSDLVVDEYKLPAGQYQNGEQVNEAMGFPFEESAWITVNEIKLKSSKVYRLSLLGQNDSSPTLRVFVEDLYCNGGLIDGNIGRLSLKEVSHVRAEITLELTDLVNVARVVIRSKADYQRNLPSANCNSDSVFYDSGDAPLAKQKVPTLEDYTGNTYNFRVCAYNKNGKLVSNSLVGTVVITGD